MTNTDFMNIFYSTASSQFSNGFTAFAKEDKNGWILDPCSLDSHYPDTKISYLGSPAFFGFGSRNSITNNFKERWQILFGNGSCDASQCIP
jgi:hypothetical protein